MARGFASGVFWGGVAGTVILASASVISSWPITADPANEQSAVVVDTPATPTPADEPQQTKAAEQTVAEPAAPVETETSSEPAPTTIETADVETPAQPAESPSARSDVIAGAQAPELISPDVTISGQDGSAPRAGTSQAPSASDVGDDPLSGEVTQTAQAPSAAASLTAEPEDPGETAATEIALAAETPVTQSPISQPPQSPGAEVAPSASEAPERPALPAPSVAAAPETDQTESVSITQEPTVSAALTKPEALKPALPEPAPAAPQNPEQPTEVASNDAETDAPQVTTTPTVRVGSLVDRQDANVRVAQAGSSRLPTIRQDVQEGVTESETQPASALPEFTNPDNKPLFALVLIDEGGALDGAEIGLDALENFPFPINIAIDANAPDAEERALEYKLKGFDVLAMIDLPEGLTASDTEVAMSVLLGKMPGAIGIIEGLNGGLQSSREMSDQVTQIAKDESLGIIWQPKALDTAQKLAARDGVPSKTLFRDFDGAGQNARAMTRFLQNAAVRAGQQNGAIMLGRLRPETVSTVLTWGVQERSGRIIFAPIRAVFDSAQ